jgi:hypothetical protein
VAEAALALAATGIRPDCCALANDGHKASRRQICGANSSRLKFTVPSSECGCGYCRGSVEPVALGRDNVSVTGMKTAHNGRNYGRAIATSSYRDAILLALSSRHVGVIELRGELSRSAFYPVQDRNGIAITHGAKVTQGNHNSKRVRNSVYF